MIMRTDVDERCWLGPHEWSLRAFKNHSECRPSLIGEEVHGRPRPRRAAGGRELPQVQVQPPDIAKYSARTPGLTLRRSQHAYAHTRQRDVEME